MKLEPAQHPDDLRLVAFAENRLLDFERDDLESHLADCPTCRALVADIALDAEGDAQVGATPLRAVGPRPALRGVWQVLFVAAALMLLVRFVPWGSSAAPDQSFELALANTRDGVFQSQRSTAPDSGANSRSDTAEFFVGVRLESSGWVRLVGFDQSGAALEIPLDETGATSVRYDGATEYIFGPYPMQLDVDQRVHTVAALVSAESLAWSSIESSSWPLDATDSLWVEQAAALGASLQVIRPGAE